MQRAPDLSPRQRGVGSPGTLAGRFDLPGDDRIECRVVPPGAFEKEIEQFKTADAPVADLVG